jgi:iron complex transport system ATP-binding protein
MALETRQLTIGYVPTSKSPHVVASGLDLSLAPGELVCLLGPNGIGKSTLMRTISGMQRRLGGQVNLSEIPIDDLPAKERARKIGIVLTERIDVGHLSSYALVSLGRYPYTDWTGRMDDEDHRIVTEAIHAVGAQDLANRPVSELSDGERQKIMIARVLAQETDVILLDEPTAFLDLPRRVEIIALLRRLAHESNKAILLSTHDLDLAVRNADRIWLMTAGHIESGIPESLVLNGAFESAFAREGIEFDEASGSFRPAHCPVGTIRFSESGLVAAWTARALERIGYAVDTSESDAELTLELEEDDGKTVWILRSEETITFLTLDELTTHLKTALDTTLAGRAND